MCTAQVLLVTDVMRAFPHEQGPIASTGYPVARGVCRRLFADELGPPTDSRPFIQATLADLHQKMKEKWNFDFIVEKPMPGRYQWVPVGPGVPRVPPTQVTEMSQQQQPATTIARQPSASRDKKLTASLGKKWKTSRNKSSTTQSKITDYLHQRKRPLSNDVSHNLKLRRLENSSVDRRGCVNDLERNHL